MSDGRVKQIRRHKSIRFFLPAIFLAMLITGGFSCNLIGPHNPSGPDTTSSNFTWTVDTIGGPGSILYDCSVVNDTLAYAVGLIMPSDSLGRSNTIYWGNAAVWNGVKWTPMQVPDYYEGKKTFSTLYAVFAFGPDDILFASGGDIEHWNGATFTTDYAVNSLINGQINKIWGSSSNNYYVVGNGGTIVHYLNGSWTKVQTGTTLPFQDIWGDGGQVLAVASSHNVAARQLYSLNGNTATAISDSGLSYVFGGLWFVAGRKYYVAGDGIFEKSSLDQASWYSYPIGEVASYYSNAIRGAGLDDIVVVGSYGDVSHYNGSEWTEYTQLFNTADRLLSVSIKDNTTLAVGYRFNGVFTFGLIYTGRR